MDLQINIIGKAETAKEFRGIVQKEELELSGQLFEGLLDYKKVKEKYKNAQPNVAEETIIFKISDDKKRFMEILEDEHKSIYTRNFYDLESKGWIMKEQLKYWYEQFNEAVYYDWNMGYLAEELLRGYWFGKFNYERYN